MSSKSEKSNELIIDDENEVYEAEEEEELDEEESQEELDKIHKLQEEKEIFVKQIRSVEKIQTNNKLDSIEAKINQLLEGAEQYASFLLTRHKQAQKKQQTREQRSRHRIILDDENQDQEDDQIDEDVPTRLNKQPTLLKGGELKDYQMNGLNWLISLYETGINGILADEMGLGKTIQTISFISFLKEFKRINGPHLVVAPKSTLGNWMKEFKKWMPCCRVVKLIALKEERDDILNKYLQPNKFDVCLTSYEGVNICLKHIKRFHFKYIIIDEAHKIKNEGATISQNMRRIKTNYKLLLSGTPLQNNPHELWSLLNYLLPDLFDSPEVFDKWFEVNVEAKSLQTEISQEELERKNLEMVQKFHKILRPFMLRRTKAEVERLLPPKKEIHLFVKLTALQRQIYQNIIVSSNPFEGGEDKSFYMNKLMQLRKVCLHPYLFPEVEDKSLPEIGEHLIQVSGKLNILDKLLRKLLPEGHQVLIFSQFTMMLNILEDYCNLRQYGFCRIDGDTEIDRRDDQIAEFTTLGSEKRIFLLSTRAGGLGINLATADTVVIYDSDFNPQMDLQAMDRAHRIGQKNQVLVYRMVTEHTVEEKIIERQQIKLRWDSLMIQQGRMHQKGGSNGRLLSKDELRDITLYGANQVFKLEGETITDDDINMFLQRGEQKTNEMNQRIDQRFQSMKDKKLDLGLGQINIFDYFEDQRRTKEDEEALDEQMALQLLMENKTRRDKKAPNYNVNQLLNPQLAATKRVQGKLIKLQEHFLYINRERLQNLLQKEEDFNMQQKLTKKVLLHQKEEQDEMKEDQPTGLTEEEKNEVQTLLSTGFIEWTKQEFQDFISGSEKFGRNEIDLIQQLIKTKTAEEVQLYKEAFWSRIDELTEKEKFVKQIERGEKMLTQKNEGQRLIQEKCQQFTTPRHDLNFTTSLYNKFKSKYFSLENDKYLIYAVNEIGYGNWTQLKKSIRTDPIFKFDHAFKCKTENELKNRITSLLKVLEKEKENNTIKQQQTLDQLKHIQQKPKPVQEKIQEKIQIEVQEIPEIQTELKPKIIKKDKKQQKTIEKEQSNLDSMIKVKQNVESIIIEPLRETKHKQQLQLKQGQKSNTTMRQITLDDMKLKKMDRKQQIDDKTVKKIKVKSDTNEKEQQME